VGAQALSTDQFDLVASLEKKCSDLETSLTLERNRVADVEMEIVSTKTQLNIYQADIASLRTQLISVDEKASRLVMEKNDLVEVQRTMEREFSATQTLLRGGTEAPRRSPLLSDLRSSTL
jgi:chromosome segregation ATPase